LCRLFGSGRSPGSASVSVSIGRILESVTKVPGINRKQLAEDLVAGISEPTESDRIKLSLASDLRWLITEGYLIEFNDGSLDLPRTKPPAAPAAATPEKPAAASETSEPTAVAAEQLGEVALQSEVPTTPQDDVAPEPEVNVAPTPEPTVASAEQTPNESTDDDVPSPS